MIGEGSAMLVGQKLGPFDIEKELGSGAMGTVYQATYTRNGQRVAIKIMAPGLLANESAVARFEREASILKQLNHPNITRLFGVGKTQGMRYYAMEFVEGESLDKVLHRRVKLGWEEVIPLIVQLCAALQHAHEKGVVHRDLKPSNLMILKDGTLKLTDFGIAKDLDVTALTGANCAVGTAAYMSPEQCRGDKDLTFKSDLYSLGVVLYELLTGQKPFLADNAMDMFLCHVRAVPERPSRKEMSIPVWLDTLILQLMEKEPENRPRDASMVAEALQRIQEKVEANQSAGEDAVKARRIDKYSEARDEKPTEEDKEAARAIKAKGKKKKKKEAVTPFYRKGWFVGVGVLALLAGVGLTLYIVLQPPSAEALYQRAANLMKSDNPDDWQKAVDGPAKEYLALYRTRPGKETEQILDWQNRVDIYNCDLLIQKHLDWKARGRELPTKSDAEKLAFEAADAEKAGKLDEARKLWGDVKKDYGSGSGYAQWGRVAEWRLRQIEEVDTIEVSWKPLFNKISRLGDESRNLSADEEAAFIAERFLKFEDFPLAKERYEELRDRLETEVVRRPSSRKFLLLAARKANALKNTQSIDRKKFLDEKLAALRSEWDRGTCSTIIALYKDVPDMQAQVTAATALMKANTQ
jgi:serine/threonine-protein kinase